MNIALACTCSIGYTYFLEVLLKSILISNPNKNYPFIVFHHSEEKCNNRYCLASWDKYQLENIYPNIIFKEINPKDHEHRQSETIKYYSLEAFGLEEYDKVIYFGADMLNVKPIDEMINFEGDICMTKELNRPKTFNNGGMIIGKKYLNKDIRNELIKYIPNKQDIYFGTDQALLCQFFENKIIEAPRKFNCLVTEPLDFKEVINWHYIIKPNTFNFVDRCGQELFDLWAKYQKVILK